MQKISFWTLALLLSAFLTPSCNHEHGEEDDSNAPVLTISAPSEGITVTGTVQIILNVTDESLHEMTVKVTKDSDGSEVFKDEPTVHDETNFNYDKSFTPNGLSGETAMTLTVEVEDHNENKTTKTVKFKVN